MTTRLDGTALIAGLCLAGTAHAVDLSVAHIEVTQGLQDASQSLPLIARNATLVRARISLNGQLTPQAGVDAVLRIYSNGVEIPESPVYSSNGPIVAPFDPSDDNINDTVNFLCLPPEGADIDFVVTVNQFATIPEDDRSNNTASLLHRVFACRKMTEIAYMPVNYVPGGGLPQSAMIEPGNGDSFLRAIYKTGDWNYHRSPLPSYSIYFDINFMNTTLLNALADIRANQIPAAGFTRPDFMYGWLPGNPYSGNGQANGTPGTVAFGNTDPLRFQRTFAHEIGHCWGQPHNDLAAGLVGVDVEAHLRDPLGLGQVMPAWKYDVMVPSLNTPDAWVAPITYLDAIDDARAACLTFGGGGVDEGNGSGGANDSAMQSVLRIAGTRHLARGSIALAPATTHELMPPTADDPHGDVLVESFAADGSRLHAVRVDTHGAGESCVEGGVVNALVPIYVNLPRWTRGVEAARVTVRDVAGPARAELVRSAHAPQVTNLSVRGAKPVAKPVATRGPSPSNGRIHIDWSARDADGDALEAELLYSPDCGNAWLPLTVAERTGSFEFNASDIPASRGPNGRFAVRVTDGMNTTWSESGSSFAAVNQPPDIYLLTPNNATTFPRGATVVLHASAWDIDEQLLAESSVSWTSSLDGALGTGRLLARRSLSVGTHVITVRGVDAGGLASEKSVTITVTPREFNNLDLDGSGGIGGPDLGLLLGDWGGHGLGDFNADGVIDGPDLSELLFRWH